jgi:hypothetical protein
MPRNRVSGCLVTIGLACLLGGCHGWSSRASDILFALNGLPSPQRINQVMSGWQGQNVSNIIGAWGPPARTIPIGTGASLFVWQIDRTRVEPAECHSQASASHGNVNANGQIWIYPGKVTTTCAPAQRTGYVAHRMFWVNADGVIYGWAWKGL